MKFLATLLLALAMLIPYYIMSNGTFYLPENTLQNLAFEQGAPLQNYFTHLFTHVGLLHFLGNFAPLLVFGLLFETATGFLSTIAVFFISGVLSSVAFAFINPSVVLVGASTGVSGLMAAATVVRPKKALVLLIALPIALFLINPLAHSYNAAQVQGLEDQKLALENNVAVLLAQNKTVEAQAQNQSLAKVQTVLLETQSGIQREKEIPTDLLVHLFGALSGAAFVFVFRKDKLKEGVTEFEGLGFLLYSNVEKIKVFFKPKN